MFSRGQVVRHKALGVNVTILGAEDFEGYEYNNPSKYAGRWELVQFPDGIRCWSPAKNLEPLE